MRSVTSRLFRLLLILVTGSFVFESLGCKVGNDGIRITAEEEERTPFDELEEFFDKVF